MVEEAGWSRGQGGRRGDWALSALTFQVIDIRDAFQMPRLSMVVNGKSESMRSALVWWDGPALLRVGVEERCCGCGLFTRMQYEVLVFVKTKCGGGRNVGLARLQPQAFNYKISYYRPNISLNIPHYIEHSIHQAQAQRLRALFWCHNTTTTGV